VFFTSSTTHLISPLGFKINDSRCATHTASQPQFEGPGRITRPALITVDRLGPRPPHRTHQPYPCRRIEQAASVRTLTWPPTPLHLPPTLLTSRCRAHRNLNKHPLNSIGLRVGTGRITMTIMAVVVQAQGVVGYDAFSRRSILLVPRKNHPFPLSKYPFFPTFTPICSAALHLFLAYLLLFVS